MSGARDTVGAGYEDDLRGFARAVLDLRDRLAPQVQVAYHLSYWGSGDDPIANDASDGRVDSLASGSVQFYRSIGARFDLTFAEMCDRDSGFKRVIYGQGDEAWWTPDDFARHVRYLQRFSAGTGQALVLWQIPYGNTVMRAVDNTWNYYQ